MCGFVGKVQLDGRAVTVDEIEFMRRMIEHRGPDDAGRCLFSLHAGRSYTPDDAVFETAENHFTGGLGFNRLSIIDLSRNGHQPMHSLDGRLIIVFNGEIYNAEEYRPELERMGCRFRGRSDTEILLNLYARFGIEGTLSRLNGMFALCIVDLANGELHLARDRLGIKPLYVYERAQTLMFSSEVKAFQPNEDFTAELNLEVLDEFLKFGHVAGSETLFRNVTNLEPGELLTLKNGRTKRRIYWSVASFNTIDEMPMSRAEDLVEQGLEQSVRLRLKSDVKVGCQLSGGIDSSLICLMATKQSLDRSPVAVSVVHPNPKVSEERWIDQVSDQIDIRVRKISLNERDFMTNIERATWHRDLPINSSSSVAIMLMSRLAKQYFTVFLSGEGADELFGGYERFFGGHFLGSPLNYHLLRLTPVARKLLTERYVTGQGEPFNRRDWLISRSSYVDCRQMRLLRPDYVSERFMSKRRKIFEQSEGDFVSKTQHYELKTWLVDLLLRQDTMTMAHAIENRVPFLDHNLVELARRLPRHCLVGNDPRFTRSTKIVVKRIAARYFGKQFAYRRKIGFHIPIADYLSTSVFNDWLRGDILPGIHARGIFDPGAVDRLYLNRGRGNHSDTYSLWRMITFEVWARQVLDNNRTFGSENSLSSRSTIPH